jgi:hypothetical protein
MQRIILRQQSFAMMPLWRTFFAFQHRHPTFIYPRQKFFSGAKTQMFR